MIESMQIGEDLYTDKGQIKERVEVIKEHVVDIEEVE